MDSAVSDLIEYRGSSKMCFKVIGEKNKNSK